MLMKMNRRMMLGGLVTAGAMTMVQDPLQAARGRPFFKRISRPIGLQLYTLGDDVAKDVEGTLAKVAAIGLADLELPQLFGKKPAELKAAADRAGVGFSAIHLAATPNVPPAMLSMKSEPQRIIDDLGALGIKDAVMPIMLFPANFRPGAGEDFRTAIARSLGDSGADIWKQTAALLNEKAAALKPHGITIGYHNHNLEFAPIGRTTGWDILMKELDPSVMIEADVGWVSAAGLDPVAFLNKHRGRVRWLHVKDVRASTAANFALQMDPTEVGSGRQPWAQILRAAHKAGCQHYYIEQEPPFTMTRLEAAAKGQSFLSALRA
jgi:sugar phosphate isomerase/epimerase